MRNLCNKIVTTLMIFSLVLSINIYSVVTSYGAIVCDDTTVTEVSDTSTEGSGGASARRFSGDTEDPVEENVESNPILVGESSPLPESSALPDDETLQTDSLTTDTDNEVVDDSSTSSIVARIESLIKEIISLISEFMPGIDIGGLTDPDIETSETPDETPIPDVEASENPSEIPSPDVEASENPDETPVPDVEASETPDETIIPDVEASETPDETPTSSPITYNQTEYDSITPVPNEYSENSWKDLDGDGDIDVIMYTDGKVTQKALENAVMEIEKGSFGRVDMTIINGTAAQAAADDYGGFISTEPIDDYIGWADHGVNPEMRLDTDTPGHTRIVLHELMHVLCVKLDETANNGDSIMDYEFGDDNFYLTTFDKGLLKYIYRDVTPKSNANNRPSFTTDAWHLK